MLGWDRADWVLHADDPAPPGFTARYASLVARRERREPVAYITGTREFWGRDFEVSPAALVPRPETEIIVEEARARLSGRGPLRVVDVGTGTGCIAVTLALELADAVVAMTDLSREALALAVRNAVRHGVRDRALPVQANLLEGLRGPFDLIVANPPYVPAWAAAALSREVHDHEPHLALFGGHDGLGLIRSLLPQVAARLAPDGLFLMEFGAGQDEAVEAVIAAVPGLRLEGIRQDLQGIPRTAIVRTHPSPMARPE